MLAVDPISKLDCETFAENVRLEYEWATNSYGTTGPFALLCVESYVYLPGLRLPSFRTAYQRPS